ncbi:uncharacterized protein [Antedon mediterranea]|uniref:uncharacterized protein n=1 Tax=Antedon mediterranea TaxID=105859 RepID=UPI003AF51FDC
MIHIATLRKGDIVLSGRVFCEFLLYKHTGIFDGENVIHFRGDKPGIVESIQTATVRISSLNEFAGDDTDKLEVITCPDDIDREEVVERAMSWVGKKFNDSTWNLFTNNCEHFSRWCIFEKAESKQLETMPSVLLEFINHVTVICMKVIREKIKPDSGLE